MILPLESQVPTRETCERLREKGFPQDTHFRLVPGGDEPWNADTDAIAQERGSGEDFTRWERGIAAPTLAELLEVLRNIEPTLDVTMSTVVEGAPPEDLWGIWHAHEFEIHENSAEAAALLWLKVKGS